MLSVTPPPLDIPETTNIIPAIIAIVDLLRGLSSMKWVHFIPTVEVITAMADRKMLSISTALVAWTSARGAERSIVDHVRQPSLWLNLSRG